MKEKVLIVGAGNWMYGDEAAGIMIADELGRRFGDVVRVSRDARLIWEVLRGGEDHTLELIVFITVAEESESFPAGSWCRMDFPGETSSSAYESLRSTRSLHVPSLMALGRHLGDSGMRVLIYALAGCDLQLGAPLSFPVKEAIQILEAHIADDLKAEIGLESWQRTQALSAVAP